MESSSEDERFDVHMYTKVKQQLETVLQTAAVSGLVEGSPVALAANQLISNLNVKA